MKQKYSSANTSINKLGRLYRIVGEQLTTEDVPTILDFGAGKYRKGTEYLREKGFTVDSYEPSLGDSKPTGKYKAILLSNVLNVIEEDEIILDILRQCKYMLDDEYSGVLITVYEGDKTGKGKPSKDDCYQRNMKTKDYTKLMLKVFDTIEIEDNVIGLQ